jgi:hypothetical protein
MPATTAKTSSALKLLTVYQAVPRLQQLAGLRINYFMLYQRLKRAKDLPADIHRIAPNNIIALAENDLPVWAEWIKTNS